MSFAIDVLLRRGAFSRRVRINSDARVVAITGHSGAGKTSILNAVAGLLRPAEGRIAVDGRVLFDARAGVDVEPWRRGIGYLFQDARLFPHLDVRRNLLYGKRRGGAVKFAFDDVVALLGIAPLLRRRTANLSGGEAQRVALGRALLSQPQVLLLDEPLASLDHARREELLAYFQRLRDEASLPMLYVSHGSEEVRRMTATVHELD